MRGAIDLDLDVDLDLDPDLDLDFDVNLTMSGALYHLDVAVRLNPSVDFIQFNHGAVLAINDK